LENARPDPHNVAIVARLLAVEKTLSVLVELIGASEPGVRDRIRGKLEDYLSGLDSASELEGDFIQKSREFTESILRAR
jgi:hypothetical protein